MDHHDQPNFIRIIMYKQIRAAQYKYTNFIAVLTMTEPTSQKSSKQLPVTTLQLTNHT